MCLIVMQIMIMYGNNHHGCESTSWVGIIIVGGNHHCGCKSTSWMQMNTMDADRHRGAYNRRVAYHGNKSCPKCVQKINKTDRSLEPIPLTRVTDGLS